MKRQRVMALKVEIDWKDDASRALYNRLRDLGWMAAHYRNQQSVAKFAQMKGWRSTESGKEPPTKAVRSGKDRQTGELSGDAYSCAEQEVQGAWTRDAKKIVAGQPVPMWRPDAALSVSGRENCQESGIRMEFDGARYALRLRAQSKDSPGGGWLVLPIAKNTKRDEWQGPIINQMVSGETPIKKVTVHVERRGVTVRLTFAVDIPELPPMGQRTATLTLSGDPPRLRLFAPNRQTKDYTSVLHEISDKKDRWDLIRRRCMAQIGRKHGHARAKRRALANLTPSEWIHSKIHAWTREIVEWSRSQGVGTIQVGNIETLDWPAYQFRQKLNYKAEEVGIKVEDLKTPDETAERSVKAEIGKGTRSVRKMRDAIREIRHQTKNRRTA